MKNEEEANANCLSFADFHIIVFYFNLILFNLIENIINAYDRY